VLTVLSDGSSEEFVVAKEWISDRAIVDPPPGQRFDSGLVITSEGPDRDVYHLPISPRFVFTLENRTDAIWDFWFDEFWFYHPDCESKAADPAFFASVGILEPTTPQHLGMDVDLCLVLPHESVHIDLPHEVGGPSWAMVVPWNGADDVTRQHRVTFDFLPQE
jgi:hypothetical protein